MSELTAGKKFIFGSIGLLFSIFIAFLFIEVFVRFYESNYVPKQQGSKKMYEYDSEIGWKLVDGTYRQLHQDFDATYIIENNKRNSFNDDLNGEDRKEVNFYGDSFCFGTGVDDEFTSSSFFAKLNKNYKINNHGTSGYGPLQYRLLHNKTKSDFLNVFLIYTGNDYQDVQQEKIAWGPYRPILKKENDMYKIVHPKADFRLIVNEEDKEKFEFRSINFVKNLLKSVPLIVKIRSQFVTPNEDFVNESMNRFNHIYSDINKETSLFVIIPSISLVSGISENSDEGYFRKNIIEYLKKNHLNYVDILSKNRVQKEDFWQHEGHNNVVGNEKIGKIITEHLKKQNQ